MKKLLALLLVLILAFGMVACGSDADTEDAGASNDAATTEDGAATDDSTTEDGAATSDNAAAADVKVGFIFLHDENSTYDLNFINAAEAACANLGITDYVLKTNVPEGQECYDTAAELADDGCDIIFADSFGHEDFMIQAAKEFPDVQFCHSTGTKAHTEGLDNYHNAFASIY